MYVKASKVIIVRALPRIILLAFVFTSNPAATLNNDSVSQSESKQEPAYVEGEILVRFKTKLKKSKTHPLHEKTKSKILRHYKAVQGLQRIKLPKGKKVKQLLKQYQNDPDVLYAEPNYLYQAHAIPSDAQFSSLWALHNQGQTGGSNDADVNAPEAWDLGVTGDSNIVIAIIDSGIDYAHEDLAANIWINPGEIPGNGVDDDNNGYIDDIHGIDAVGNDSDPRDDQGHGTHVAGTIAARGNNGAGIAGVNWNTKLLACKYLRNNFGTASNAIECMDYILQLKTRAQNPVNIVASNNSWGSGAYSQALQDAIIAHRDAGILYVASAGNNSNDNDSTAHYPARYQSSNIIVVAATDDRDNLAGFSNTGRRTVHVAAPGVDILSTVPGVDNYIPQPGDLFFDDVESASAGWSVDAPWAISTDRAYSPNQAWADSPGGNYGKNVQNSLVSPIIDLSQTAGIPLVLGFWAWHDLEQDADVVYVEASNNGFAFSTTLLGGPITGRDRQWRRYNFIIPDTSTMRHSNFQFRLRLVSDGQNQFDGIHIDNIGIADQSSYPSNRYELYNGTSMAAPHVSGLLALLKAQDAARDWIALKNLVLAGGQNKAVLADKTITGKRLRAWDSNGTGSMSCNNQVVLHRLQPVADTLFASVGEVVNLSMLHINCAVANGAVDVTVTGPAGSTVLGLSDNGSGFDEVAGDGVYSAQWIPSAAGNYSIAFADGSTLNVNVLANYLPAQILSYNYRDISAVATNLSLGDDQVITMTAPFLIHFGDYASGFNQVSISSNGVLSFEPLASSLFSNKPLPGNSAMTLAAPLWTDLNATTGGVYWAVIGSAPNRELIVEWRGVARYPTIGNSSFQVVLFEANSDVLFNYSDVVFGDVLHDYGASATAGVQVGKARAQEYSYNSPALSDSLGLLWQTQLANTAPVANAQNLSTTEDNALNIVLTASDIDNDPLSYNVVTPVANGSLTGTPPNLSYTPNADFHGTDSFAFVANDGAVDSVSATVSITVTPVNDAPIVDNQGLSLQEDSSVVVTLTGSDIDNDPLSYNVVTMPANGSLTGTPPNLSYTPNADFHGTDSFAFVANDGNVDSASATVSITVTPVNDAPVATAQNVTTPEDTALTLTLTGTDADNDPLSYSLLAGPLNGSVTGTPPNLSYTPNADFSGSDSVSFSVNDGTVDSAAATVSITVVAVNDAPVANDQSLSTQEDQAIGITLTASDTEGDSLIYSISAAPLHGSLTGTPPNLNYTPDPDYVGNDSFSFKVNDGVSDSNIATVNLSISPVNDAPLAIDQTLDVNEDSSFNVIVLQGSDVDDDLLSYTLISTPGQGTLSGSAPNLVYEPNPDFHGADSFRFKVNDSTVDSNIATVSINVNAVNDAPLANNQSLSVSEDSSVGVTLTGSDIDNDPLSYNVVTVPANGSITGTPPNLTYTPNADFHGADSFTFVANDSSVDSVAATVSIAVTPVNDIPLANVQSLSTAEDNSVSITLTGSDIDDDALSYRVLTGPLNGALNGTAPNLTYVPNTYFNGNDSFTYVVNDGTVDSVSATVSITVTAVNNAPGAQAQSLTTTEDSAIGLTLMGTDIDADALSYLVVTIPSHGSLSGSAPNLVYTPNADFHGTDSFGFVVNDGTVDSAEATVQLTVNPVNDAPSADDLTVSTAEDGALNLVLPASDIDADSLSYSVLSAPLNGTLSGTSPSLTYTPNTDFDGSDSFTFKASDGIADSNTATVSITVTPVNDAPVAQGLALSTLEGAALSIVLSASDIDADSLSYSVLSAPLNGTLSGTLPNLTYTPNANFNGSDSLSYNANDGALDSNTATVTIAVGAVNDAPLADNQNLSLAEDGVINIVLSGSDADDDTLSYRIVNGPTQGVLGGSAPNMTYTPQVNFHGADSFTFVANDGVVDSTLATVSITVTPVNDVPMADEQSMMVAEDSTISVTLTGSDIDNNTLNYSVIAGPSHGSLAGSAPNLTYTPTTNFTGSDSFTFKVNDGITDSVSATVSITVNALNDTPLAEAQNISTQEDQSAAILLAGSDADNDSLSFHITTMSAHGALSGTPPNLTYTPNADFNGSDSFAFVANDGAVDSPEAMVSITVTPVNDAPHCADASITTDEDVETAITLTAVDGDNDAMTYYVVTAPSHGVLSGKAPKLHYMPDANFNGTDSFSFKANDGTVDSAVATLSITVSAVNDAPVAKDQTMSVAQDSVDNAIVLDIQDIDSAVLTHILVSDVSNGTLSGTAPALRYTPNTGYTGNDSFRYRISDGSLDSKVAKVTITVLPLGIPVAQDQTINVTEDSSANPVTLLATDADGDVLTYTMVKNPQHGRLSGNAPVLDYTPDKDFHGSDSFSFRASDGSYDSNTATVSISITAVNDAPTAPQLINPQADEQNVSPVSATFSWRRAEDVDGDSINYELHYCGDSSFSTCSPTLVAGIHAPIVLAGAGGIGAMMFLGMIALGQRRRKQLYIIGMLLLIAHLSACGSGGGGGSAPQTRDNGVISTTVTGLKPGTLYYWKVVADDGNGGRTESEIWNFTTRP